MKSPSSLSLLFAALGLILAAVLSSNVASSSSAPGPDVDVGVDVRPAANKPTDDHPDAADDGSGVGKQPRNGTSATGVDQDGGDDDGDEDDQQLGRVPSPRLSLQLPVGVADVGPSFKSGEQNVRRNCYTCDSKRPTPSADTGAPSAGLMPALAQTAGAEEEDEGDNTTADHDDDEDVVGAPRASAAEPCCDVPRRDQLVPYMAPLGYHIYCYTLFDSENKGKVVSRGAEFLSDRPEPGCSKNLGDQHMCLCDGADGCNSETTADGGARCSVAVPYNIPPGGGGGDDDDDTDDADEPVKTVVFDPPDVAVGEAKDRDGNGVPGTTVVSLLLTSASVVLPVFFSFLLRSP